MKILRYWPITAHNKEQRLSALAEKVHRAAMALHPLSPQAKHAIRVIAELSRDLQRTNARPIKVKK